MPTTDRPQHYGPPDIDITLTARFLTPGAQHITLPTQSASIPYQRFSIGSMRGRLAVVSTDLTSDWESMHTIEATLRLMPAQQVTVASLLKALMGKSVEIQ